MTPGGCRESAHILGRLGQLLSQLNHFSQQIGVDLNF
jgi:hypothetical protein